MLAFRISATTPISSPFGTSKSRETQETASITSNLINSPVLDLIFFFFFSMWVFFHEHSRFTGQQGKGEGIYLTPLYHFHPLHRHLDISWAITAEGSPLHIAGSRTRTRNLWFPGASRCCYLFMSSSVILVHDFLVHMKGYATNMLQHWFYVIANVKFDLNV